MNLNVVVIRCILGIFYANLKWILFNKLIYYNGRIQKRFWNVVERSEIVWNVREHLKSAWNIS